MVPQVNLSINNPYTDLVPQNLGVLFITIHLRVGGKHLTFGKIYFIKVSGELKLQSVDINDLCESERHFLPDHDF